VPHGEPGTPGDSFQVWGVRPLVPAAAGLLCAGFAVWLLIATAPEDRLVAGAGVCVSAIAAGVLVTMRRRLTADHDGFVVRGPLSSRTIGWGQVVQISAPTRRRRGLASSAVEVDLDDDGLIVLGKIEVGADPAEVAVDLRRWWRPGHS
jgi:hypothetical protein